MKNLLNVSNEYNIEIFNEGTFNQLNIADADALKHGGNYIVTMINPHY